MTNDEKSLDILYQIGSYQREKVMIEIIIKQDRNLTGNYFIGRTCNYYMADRARERFS